MLVLLLSHLVFGRSRRRMPLRYKNTLHSPFHFLFFEKPVAYRSNDQFFARLGGLRFILLFILDTIQRMTLRIAHPALVLGLGKVFG